MRLVQYILYYIRTTPFVVAGALPTDFFLLGFHIFLKLWLRCHRTIGVLQRT